jgi:hypothetical protein
MSYAELEHVSSLIRVWVDDNKFGDPYEWAAAVRWLNKQEVEICLQQQRLTPSVYRAVIKVLKSYGVSRILIKTYPEGSKGKEKIRWLDISVIKEL